MDLSRVASVRGLNKTPPHDFGSSSSGEHEPDEEDGLEQEVEGYEEHVRRADMRTKKGFYSRT